MKLTESVTSQLNLVNRFEAKGAGIKEFFKTYGENITKIAEDGSIFAKGKLVKNDIGLESPFVNSWEAYNENIEQQKAEGKQTFFQKLENIFKGLFNKETETIPNTESDIYYNENEIEAKTTEQENEINMVGNDSTTIEYALK